MAQSHSQFAIPENPTVSDREDRDRDEPKDPTFSLPVDSETYEQTAGSTSDIIKALVIQKDEGRFHELRHLLPPTHSCDFDFQQAIDFEKAKVRIQSENWDIIFIELKITEGNEPTLLDDVLDFAGSHPLIVLTPMKYEHIARQAIREGAQDYIVYEEAIPQLLHRTIWSAIDRFNLTSALQIKTKEVERAFWQKHQFLSTLSHEIKTPMNGIRGGMQLLREDSVDVRQIESINMIDGAINQLMILIDNLLEHGKAESGKISIHRTSTALDSLVETLKCTFQMACEVKGLDLKFELSHDTPEYAYIDELRLRQVLSNLIGNAIKFSDTGEIVVSISDSGEHALKFQVKDSGRGIPGNKQNCIFQPYDQGDDCSETGSQGTGLGLAICKEFVEAMGGEISVTSEPGHGSNFQFTVSTQS